MTLLPHKNILIKYRQEGLSYRQIAAKYGVSPEGVRQAIFRDKNPKEARKSGMPPIHITRHLQAKGYSPYQIKAMFTYKRTDVNGRLKSNLRYIPKEIR